MAGPMRLEGGLVFWCRSHRGSCVRDLARWAGWTVMASHLAELCAALRLPAHARQARAAARPCVGDGSPGVEAAAAVGWLERRPQIGFDVFARGQPKAAGMTAGPCGDPQLASAPWAKLGKLA